MTLGLKNSSRLSQEKTFQMQLALVMSQSGSMAGRPLWQVEQTHGAESVTCIGLARVAVPTKCPSILTEE